MKILYKCSNVEILQLFDSINESDAWSEAYGFSTVLGGTNSDTIVLTKFDANLTVSTVVQIQSLSLAITIFC